MIFSTKICDRLWQKQAVGLKISFVHFLLELINNNFWLKCWKNYYSIFMGYSTRKYNFEKMHAKFNDTNRNPNSACVFNLKFLGITKTKRQNEAIFSKL